MNSLQKWARQAIFATQSPAIAASIAFIVCQLIEYIAFGFVSSDQKSECHWDCSWYQSIVESGYDQAPHAHYKSDAANWAFFPVFPVMAKIVWMLSDLTAADALIATGKVAFAVSIYLFIKMAQSYSVNASPLLLAMLPAANPYAIYGNTGYTEPAFLALTCFFFIALKRNQSIVGGLTAGILSATRFVGTTAGLIYGIYAFKQLIANKNKQPAQGLYIGLLLAPIGLSGFMIYLYWLTGDALAFSHVQIAWKRSLHNPLGVILGGLSSGDLMLAYFALAGIFGLGCAIYLAITKKWELAIFSFACTLIPLCTGLESMPRYVFWQAPVLMVLAIVLGRTKLWPLICVGSFLLLFQNFVLWLNFSTAIL